MSILLIVSSGCHADLIEDALQGTGREISLTCIPNADLDDVLQQKSWDAVIGDMNFEDDSAGQALEIIRRHDRHLPFIIIADNPDERKAVELMEAGAHDCLSLQELDRLPRVLERDMTSVLLRRRLDDNERLLGDIARRIPGYIFQRVQSPDGSFRFTYLSASLLEQFGVDPGPLKADPANFWAYIHPDDREYLAQVLASAHAELAPYQTEYRAILPEGRVVWVRVKAQPTRLDNGDVVWDGIGLDITAEKSAQEQLNYLAYYDSVTGLPKRHLFFDRLDQAIKQAGRSNAGFALHMLDLDNFKEVNDSCGHMAGDMLLRHVAMRLSRTIRESDTLARFGGDEFTLIQAGATELSAVEHLADKLLAALEQPFVVEGRSLQVQASIGIACYGMLIPEMNAEDEQVELIRRADAALYDAKSRGRGIYRCHADGLQVFE